MLRLCSESSRSYPGRSALHALSIFYNKSRHGPYRVTKVQASPAVADGGETRILSAENIRRAWKQVRANKGAPGIDGVTVEQFPDTFRELWPQIRSNLFEGTYVPSPVLRVEIPKPDGSKRPLGIPTVLDRMIQQAISQVMGLIFDPLFSESSCGFRQGVVGAGGLKPPATRLESRAPLRCSV
jgi:retron-type reverse transcriptase